MMHTANDSRSPSKHGVSEREAVVMSDLMTDLADRLQVQFPSKSRGAIEAALVPAIARLLDWNIPL